VFVDYDQNSYGDVLHHLPDNAEAALQSYVVTEKAVILSNFAVSPINTISCPSSDEEGQLNDVKSNAGHGEPVNPNINGFSASLSCYPIVKEIARSVDLNTLDALSRTCRQFRANLLPFRHQLIKEALRCENEYIETLSALVREGATIPNNLRHAVQLLTEGALPDRLSSTKLGKCARDMVAECRRCSRVVCRVEGNHKLPPDKHAVGC